MAIDSPYRRSASPPPSRSNSRRPSLSPPASRSGTTSDIDRPYPHKDRGGDRPRLSEIRYDSDLERPSGSTSRKYDSDIERPSGSRRYDSDVERANSRKYDS